MPTPRGGFAKERKPLVVIYERCDQLRLAKRTLMREPKRGRGPWGQKMNVLLQLLVGALGGLSATGPMTVGMIFLHRLLPVRHRYSLPPREITLDLAEKVGIKRKLDDDARAALTLINHFGYGATAATVYSLAESKIPLSAVLKGPIFGAMVWLVSYLGLLPALGILEPATKHPPTRNLLMIIVHLIWGLMVGVFVDTLLAEKKRTAGALLVGSPLRQKDRKVALQT
jgi:uncharacterized membrane protein YagU involved in acid resistance